MPSSILILSHHWPFYIYKKRCDLSCCISARIVGNTQPPSGVVFLDIACQNGKNESVLCRARITQLTPISCVFLPPNFAEEGFGLLGFSARSLLGELYTLTRALARTRSMHLHSEAQACPFGCGHRFVFGS